MAPEALPPVGAGLEHASPELLTLLHSIEDELLNNPLLNQEEVPASAGTELKVEEPPNDAVAKDNHQAKGARKTSKKDTPHTKDTSAPKNTTPVTEDLAAVAVLEDPKPEIEDEFDLQIKAVQAEASHLRCYLH